MTISSLMCTLSFAILVIWHNNVTGLALQGIDVGAIFAMLMRRLVEAVPYERTGATIGLHSTLRVVCGSAEVALVAA